jgi:hypothetical protein
MSQVPPPQNVKASSARHCAHAVVPTNPTSTQETDRGLSQLLGSQKQAQKSIMISSHNKPTSEPWEVKFEAAPTTQAKVDILLETLGHEDFFEALRISVRKAVCTLPDDVEISPFNPLPLWHCFIRPEVLNIIAKNMNDNESIAYEQKEKHTKWERSWHDVSGDDIRAFFGASMLMGVHRQAPIADYWNCSQDKPIFPLQSLTALA